MEYKWIWDRIEKKQVVLYIFNLFNFPLFIIRIEVSTKLESYTT